MLIVERCIRRTRSILAFLVCLGKRICIFRFRWNRLIVHNFGDISTCWSPIGRLKSRKIGDISMKEKKRKVHSLARYTYTLSGTFLSRVNIFLLRRSPTVCKSFIRKLPQLMERHISRGLLFWRRRTVSPVNSSLNLATNSPRVSTRRRILALGKTLIVPLKRKKEKKEKPLG